MRTENIQAVEITIWAHLDYTLSDESIRDMCAAVSAQWKPLQMICRNESISSGRRLLVFHLSDKDGRFQKYLSGGIVCPLIRTHLEEIRLFCNGFAAARNKPSKKRR